MKICLAQISTANNTIEENIKYHLRIVNIASIYHADAGFFPELSLSGYEPGIAKDAAQRLKNISLSAFQKLSDQNNITIGVGLPTVSSKGIHISMKIFQPGKSEKLYSKQYLHEDELPCFVEGEEQLFIYHDKDILCPAICYESLLEHHALNAHEHGTNIYIASVAKPEHGVDKALKHFPVIAKKYSMYVMMVNSVGFCDNFESVGNSSFWDTNGKLIRSLNKAEQSLLFADTDTGKTHEHIL